MMLDMFNKINFNNFLTILYIEKLKLKRVFTVLNKVNKCKTKIKTFFYLDNNKICKNNLLDYQIKYTKQVNNNQ